MNFITEDEILSICKDSIHYEIHADAIWYNTIDLLRKRSSDNLIEYSNDRLKDARRKLLTCGLQLYKPSGVSVSSLTDCRSTKYFDNWYLKGELNGYTVKITIDGFPYSKHAYFGTMCISRTITILSGYEEPIVIRLCVNLDHIEKLQLILEDALVTIDVVENYLNNIAPVELNKADKKLGLIKQVLNCIASKYDLQVKYERISLDKYRFTVGTSSGNSSCASLVRNLDEEIDKTSFEECCQAFSTLVKKQWL